MVTQRNRAQDGTAPPKGEVPIEDEGVRRQLERLFGESLFGSWPELEQNADKPQQRPRSYAFIWRLAVLALIVAVVWGGRALLKPGLKRQVDDDRANYAQELQTFVNDGNLERAAQFVPLVRGNSAGPEKRDIDPKDLHLDLIVSAEAELYRYFDADPERVRRIRPFVEDAGQRSPLRHIASLTILSREERAARLAELESLRNDLPHNNELEYLLATALEFRDDAKAARQAWENSEKLGPAWLGHRFEQAWFELRQERKPAAQKIASQIVRVDPDSAWAKLAIVTFALPKNTETDSVRSDAAAPSVAPVQIFLETFQQSIEAARRGDSTQAKERLFAAADAIHFQTPFLFDAFDWLIAEEQFALAPELTKLPDWPRDSKIAQAKLERLSAIISNPPPTRLKAASGASGGSRPSRSAWKRKAKRRAPK